MAILDGASVEILYGLENVTFGTLSAQPWTRWRLTERNINAEREALRTAEVGTDGQTDAGKHGIQNNVGRFGCEIGLVKQDHMLAWLLGNAAWTAAGTGDIVDPVTTKSGLSIIKSYGATANVMRQFLGCTVQRATLRAGVRQIPTIDFDVVCKSIAEVGTGALVAGQPVNAIAAPTNESFSPFVGEIDIGTLTDRKICTGIELNINAGYEFAHGLFDRNPQDVLKGNYSIDGRLTLHLDTTDLATIEGYGYTEQTIALRWRFEITAGGGTWLEFHLPAVKMWPVTDNPPQQGLIPVEMRFEANRGSLLDPVATKLMRIRRKNA